MRRFVKTGMMLAASLLLWSCAGETINAKRGGIMKTDAELRREDVSDYMTYLKLTKEIGPLDQDYILLSFRLIREMVLDDMFKDRPERVKIALRDVLNYHPTAEVRPAIVHEAVEHELMNTESMWVVDGSVPYEYVLDVELGEIPIKNDDQSEDKALSVMLVLFDIKGNQVGEWFGFMKREKGGKSWY
ncbi:MAG: hypothetical protein J5787_09760 [Alphaproteobacteria bacterium]|nr:hypothetical protein [Alphaproteobacteria bacterium]MBO4642981.1 hypothetical protein [Alphaproteobacteria bacterium]